MSQDEPIVAYKFANEVGLTETKYFRFVEFEPDARNAIPQGMLDVWEWERQQMINEMTESKLVLQNYSKM